jgi:hypothetical protein
MALTAMAFVLFAGCGGPGVDQPVTGPPVIAQAGVEDQTCSRDSECVLVQDCCGCDREGRQLAVHRDRVQPLSEASAGQCAAVTCTVAHSSHRSCTATRAVCRGGRCIPAVQ